MKRTTPLLLVLLCLCSLTYSQKRVQSTEISVSAINEQALLETVKGFQLVQIDLKQFLFDVSTPEETNIIWDINEAQRFDMRIFPHEIRSPSFQASIVTDKEITKVELGKTITYKGYLADGGSIRLTMEDDFIHGSIQTDKGRLYIEQLKYFLKDETINPNQLVLYYENDIKESIKVCGTIDDFIEQEIRTEMQYSSSSGCNIIEVALDCDSEYWNDWNDSSFSRMLSEINMIQDVYEDELNSIISVTSTNVIIGSAYTSTNGSVILTEIDNLWSSSPFTNIPRDLVHHFTGKDTGPFGQASIIGGVCNDSNPVCWSEDRANVDQTMAHEIGHILGGIHEDGQNCPIPFQRTIMCQGDNKIYHFSTASINRITNIIDNRSCLNYNSVTIAGASSMCINNTKTYSLQNFDSTNDTDITWSTNSRLTIISGQGTENVVVKGAINGQGVLTATLNYPGSCGIVTETKNILVGPPIMSVSISGPDTSGWITATASGGSSPYTWTLNNSTTWITTSATTSKYVGCNGGYLYVQSTNSCGTGSGSAFIQPCSGGYYSTVYPNPSNKEINVVESKEYRESNKGKSVLQGFLTLTLFDINGSAIKVLAIDGGKEKIWMDVSDVIAGNYFLLINGKEIKEVHQIIIR